MSVARFGMEINSAGHAINGTFQIDFIAQDRSKFPVFFKRTEVNLR